MHSRAGARPGRKQRLVTASFRSSGLRSTLNVSGFFYAFTTDGAELQTCSKILAESKQESGESRSSPHPFHSRLPYNLANARKRLRTIQQQYNVMATGRITPVTSTGRRGEMSTAGLRGVAVPRFKKRRAVDATQ